MPDTQVPAEDPLGLDAVDRAIRINELEQKLGDLDMVTSGASDDCPPEVHEQFLHNILAYETAPLSSHFERLERAGIELPAPDSLDAAALHAKLWEVIHALAGMDTSLYHTDHLSDRQLYEHLWSDSLRELEPLMPVGSGWHCCIDLIGSGSDEDIEIGLRYYDDEEQRQWWAKDFPDMVIPPHEKLPFDRDRHLPCAEPELPGSDDPDDE